MTRRRLLAGAAGGLGGLADSSLGKFAMFLAPIGLLAPDQRYKAVCNRLRD